MIAGLWFILACIAWCSALYGWLTMPQGGFSAFVVSVLGLLAWILATIGMALVRFTPPRKEQP